MKTFIISLAMLFALIIAVLSSFFVLNKELDNQMSELDIIYEHVEKRQWQDAKEKSENFKITLENKNFLLSTLVEHIDLDNLLTQSELAKEYIKKEVESDSLAQIRATRYMLEHIKDKNAISWGNIL